MSRIRTAAIALLTLALTVPATASDWPPVPPLPPGDAPTSAALPPSIVAEPDGTALRCTFRYTPAQAVHSVNLAGTFNGWSRDATPMTPASNGAYAATLPLGPGVHQYKFIVDGDRWIPDPLNPDRISDNHGGENTVLRLGRLASLSASPAKTGDGRIDVDALEHDPRRTLYFQPLSATSALLRYRTFARDVEQVALAVRGEPLLEMTRVERGPVFDLYETIWPQSGSPAGSPARHDLEYTFVLQDGAQRGSDPTIRRASLSDADIFVTPEWARHAIWYQIMVDRFRNGDPANDPDPVTPWTMDWFATAPFEGRDGQTFYKYFVFLRLYGGDIQGVIAKLDYLKGLGVSAIYFNPVFESPSHHKYNATTYVHVDDNFGTRGDYAAAEATEDPADPTTWTWTASDKLFLELIRQAHARGMRVILDGVFNHVGDTHPAFVDLKKNGPQSRFADWFDVTSWEPFRYNGWAGVDTLPAFKKGPDGLASRAVVEHIFAVTRRWMDPNGDGDPRDGIDGWRLDVPNEIAMPFWVEWRKLVKSINPDAYITGEIWDRAEQWLDGKHFDAVMNYQFAHAVCAWVFNRDRKIKASELDRRLRELRLAYPQAATLVLQNLINSHDTDRLVSMAHNPDRAFDAENRVQDNGPRYNNEKPPTEAYARARLVALLQMTYVGAPMIFYGDEVGMWGADDPTCRKPMLWEDLQPYQKPDENYVMREQLDYYKGIVALRNAHPALRIGAVETLLADDDKDVWTFQRTLGGERLIVALNASSQSAEVRVPLGAGGPTAWKFLHGGSGSVTAQASGLPLRVPPISGAVLLAETAQ